MSTEPEFSLDREYGVRREIGAATKFFQDGHYFDMAHRYLGPDPKYKAPKEPELPGEEPSAGVLTRAKVHSENLDGFTVPEEIAENKKEDAKVRAAELLAS